MSGIYLHKPAYQSPPDAIRTTLRRMLKPACRLSNDTEEVLYTADTACGVIHHGVLRSAGISSSATNSPYRIASCGSYWLDHKSKRLASPDELALSLHDQNGLGEGSLAYGNYIIVILDTLKQRIIIENDLLGVYPLYYCQDNQGNVAVASEIKSLLPFVKKEINHDSIEEMLFFGYIVTPSTLIAGIKKLPPNSRLIINNNNSLRIHHLNRPKFTRHKHADGSFLEGMHADFNLALQRYQQDSNDITVSLSGGLDSRIAMVAAKQLGFNVRTFSAGVPGSLECRVASDFSQRENIHCSVHEFDGSHFSQWFKKAVWWTEGCCPPGHMHFLDGLFSGQWSPGLQLHGLIGDAVAGGDFDVPGKTEAPEQELRAMCLNSLTSFMYWPHGAYAKTYKGKTTENEVQERVAHEIFNQINFQGSYSDYLWFRYLYRVNGFTIPCLGSQILPWNDPVFPFLDPSFFTLCAQADSHEIADRKMQIQWAKEYYPEVATIPRVKDGVLIDLENAQPHLYQQGINRLNKKKYLKYLVTRLSRGRINIPRKETYPYYDQWYRKWKTNRIFFDKYLLAPQCLDRGLWEEDGIKHLMRDLRVGRNVWNTLATILMIEIFCKQFLDGETEESTIE